MVVRKETLVQLTDELIASLDQEAASSLSA